MTLAPVAGFMVPAGRRAYVVVGGSSTKLGRWRIDAFTISYRIGSHRYRAVFHQGLGIRVVRHCSSC